MHTKKTEYLLRVNFSFFSYIYVGVFFQMKEKNTYIFKFKLNVKLNKTIKVEKNVMEKKV